MGKSLEMRRKKNIDSFNEIDEINWDRKSSPSGKTQEELDSIRDLLETDWVRELLDEESEPQIAQETQTPSSWDLTEETRKRDAERKLSQLFGGRFGGYSGIDSSKMTLPKSKFSAIDIGKETINTPTQAKQEARQQETILENERNIESITK